MKKGTHVYHSFDVHIGGIFAVPTEREVGSGKLDATKAREKLIRLLSNTKDAVEKVWDFKDLLGEKSAYLDSTHIEVVEGEYQPVTYGWGYPLIFRLKVDKGFSFVDSENRTEKTNNSIDAIILYNGLWFIALTDTSQFPDFNERFFCGPNLRDILVSLMKNNKLFVPVIVPPCVIPSEIEVEIQIKEGQKKDYPRYINAYTPENSTNYVLHYETQTRSISAGDIVAVIMHIYTNIKPSLDKFYILKGRSDKEGDKREKVLEQYEQACQDLKAYLNIPLWNIFKRNRVASKLSKDVSNIQVQLVSNRLSEMRIMEKSGEIDTMAEQTGIIQNMREYLKECVIEDFKQGSIEFEALTGVLSHIERLSSQQVTILLTVVAIASALVGALIGSWLG